LLSLGPPPTPTDLCQETGRHSLAHPGPSAPAGFPELCTPSVPGASRSQGLPRTQPNTEMPPALERAWIYKTPFLLALGNRPPHLPTDLHFSTRKATVCPRSGIFYKRSLTCCHSQGSWSFPAGPGSVAGHFCQGGIFPVSTRWCLLAIFLLLPFPFS
jgi:hypothetical protein